MSLTRTQLKAQLDASILEALVSQPTLSYRFLAVMFEVSPKYIVNLARANSIIRKHGRKPGISNAKVEL